MDAYAVVKGKSMKLTIHGIHAENLIIADMTTSDPFIIISLDDDEIERTSIKYKNLNPRWEGESFAFDLFLVQGKLLFRIYDYDKGAGKDKGDFMGEVELDLATVTVGPHDSAYTESVDISKVSKSKTFGKSSKGGHLSFSLNLNYNYELFKVIGLAESQSSLSDAEEQHIQTEMDLTCKRRGDFEYEEVFAKLMSYVTKDIETARAIFVEGDPVGSVERRVLHLADTLAARLRNMVVLGWSCVYDFMVKCIERIFHEYVFEITAEFARIFDKDNLQALDGLDKKVQAVSFFFKYQGCLVDAVEQPLRFLGLQVVPVPRIADMFDIQTVLIKYANNLYSQMKQYPQNVINTAIKNSDRSEFKVSPWAAIKPKNATYYRSTTPEDLLLVLNECLGYASIPSAGADDLARLTARLDVGFMKAFCYLSVYYSRALDRVWTTSRLEEYPAWLCSVSNDIDRILSEHLFVARRSDSEEVMLKAKDIVAEFSAVQEKALDITSSLLFEAVFDGASKKKFPSIEEGTDGLKTELKVYKDFFADKRTLGKFLEMAACKAVVMYLKWILVTGQADGTKDLHAWINKTMTVFSSAIGGEESLKPFADKFAVINGMLLDANKSALVVSEIWPVPTPKWTEPLLEPATKLYATILEATRPASPKGSTFKVPTSKMAIPTFSLASMKETFGIEDSSPLIAALTTPGSKVARRHSFLAVASSRMHMSSKPPNAPFEAAETENVLNIKGIKVSDLALYGAFKAEPLKNVQIEFSLDTAPNDKEDKIAIKYSEKEGQYFEAKCDIFFSLKGKLQEVNLICSIYYSNSVLSSLGESKVYGRVKIPLVLIDPLDMSGAGCQYEVELFDKEMEEQQKAAASSGQEFYYPSVKLDLNIS